MDELLGRVIGIGGALLGGAIVKEVSKSGNRNIHEYGSPLAAVLFGAGFEAVTGQTLNPEMLLQGGLINGSLATFSQSVYKGGRNVYRRKKT